MTKDLVLQALRSHAGEFVSGAALSEELGISRTAVWKAVEVLRGEGWPIESQPRRGHRLAPVADVLSEEGIRRYLRQPGPEVRFFPSITSTNTVLKQLALQDVPAGLALVAETQTGGRGRMGRSFYSPPASGLYLSLLLRPRTEASKAVLLTACAAVAVAETVEELSGVRPGIKWVNDLLVDGRKICGILTEAGLDVETGLVSHVIVGIGINTRIPREGFPEELRDIAGAAFGTLPVPDLRCRLAAGILNRLWTWAEDPGSEEIFEKYRSRSLAPGQGILILEPGKDPVPAVALGLDRDYALRVRLEDGDQRLLRSGEISIRTLHPGEKFAMMQDNPTKEGCAEAQRS